MQGVNSFWDESTVRRDRVGQFARQEHRECGQVTLHSAAPPGDDSGLVGGRLRDEQLLAFTRRQGRRIAHRVGRGVTFDPSLDGEDYGSEVLVRVLQARARADERLARAETRRGVLDRGALAGVAASDHDDLRYGRHVALMMSHIWATGMNNAYNRQAMQMFLAEKAEFERVHGQPMGSRDRDDLAADIRMRPCFSAGRRPADGFHIRQRTERFSALNTDDQRATLNDVEAALRRGIAGLSQSRSGHRTERAEQVHDLLDAGRRAEARKTVWGAVKDDDAPDVVRGSLSEKTAARTRSVVAAGGGAVAAARAHLDGHADEQTRLALFAPFGADTLTPAQCDAVAQTLTRFPAYADSVFDAAVAAATAPRTAA